jgi:mono/diheme cytochrome c family protein
MVDQPSFRPQENPRGLPEGSIPVFGWEAPMSIQEAERRLSNPVAATAASLKRGERLYRIYCFPCHGLSALGDGPVAAKMMKAANLTEEKYVRAQDGFFYQVVRNGSGLMPPHAESLAPVERWHVVNYVRKLQRQ